MSGEVSPTASMSQNLASKKSGTKIISPEVKEELETLYKAFMGIFLLEPFLMKFMNEGGWQGIFADTEASERMPLLIIVIVIVGAFILLSHYLFKAQGINKAKVNPPFIGFILIVVLTVYGLTQSDFSLYNWADWLSDILGYAQVVMAYLMWKKINDCPNQ
jgi:hypothetical protein